MSKQMNRSLVSNLVAAVAIVFACGSLMTATAQRAQGSQANAHAEATPQPLYNNYKGVRLGMSPEEVRAVLGKPLQSDAEQEYYVISANETAQLVYEAHKVTAISVDYLGGVGAPDYKAIVGSDVEIMPDGSIHQLVMYEKLGFWVSYNRGAGNTPVVTVTIQKIIK